MATATKSIREIVTTEPSAAAILLRFDIDLCSRADETLQDACSALQISTEQVVEKLEESARGVESPDVSNYTTGRLIQHIVRVHHKRVREELPRLVEVAHKLVTKHEGRSPELKQVAALMEDLHERMSAHIRKEEQVLFPYIAQVDEAPLLAFRPPQHCFTTVGQPVFMMVQEHEAAEVTLIEMRAVTGNFQAPEWACPTLIAFYEAMKRFDSDLHEHVRLENELLFPRAIEMEKALMMAGAQ